LVSIIRFLLIESCLNERGIADLIQYDQFLMRQSPQVQNKTMESKTSARASARGEKGDKPTARMDSSRKDVPQT